MGFFDQGALPTNPGDVVLTGVPRSGTTLACRLLSELPDVVALNEPMERKDFKSPNSAVHRVAANFVENRASLHRNGTARARTSAGKVSDNAFSKNSGVRRRVVERTPVTFDKPLSPGFTLVIKQCAEFTLILPRLREIYPCFAMIRNPVSILGSWNSVGVPVSRGRVARSKQLNREFHMCLDDIQDLHERQLFILDWYFAQYADLSPKQVIRYEDLMATGGKALQVIRPQAAALNEPLENKNTSDLYDHDLIAGLGRRLLERDCRCWDFYRKDEVEAVLQELG